MSTVAEPKPVDSRVLKRTILQRRRTISWTVESVALCVWLGGLVVIGAVVAPVAFQVIRTAPALAGNPALQNQMAGAVVGGSLKVLNEVSTSCFIALVFSRGFCNWRVASGYYYGPIIIAVAIQVAQTYYLFPAMDLLQANGNMSSFERLHNAYVYLTYVQMAALIALACRLNYEKAKLATCD